jgi:hypothetical protein
VAARHHDDILRFYVPVQHAAVVRLRGRFGDLDADPDQRGFVQTLRFEHSRQRAAIDVLHDDVIDRRVRADVEHGADVRMIETRERLGFPLESPLRLAVAPPLPSKRLDRDLAIQARIACFEHFAHTAAAKRAHDNVGTEPRTWLKRHASGTRDYIAGGRRL